MFLATVTVAVLSAKAQVCRRGTDAQTCRASVGVASDALVLEVCRAEYARTRDPHVGAQLAESLRRSGDWNGAAALAETLVGSPAQADAYWVMGWVAREQDLLDVARQHFEHALELHERAEQWIAAARDAYSLCNVLQLRGEYVSALGAVQRSLALASKANARRETGLAHLNASRVLAEVGHWAGAQAEVERGAAFLDNEPDRYWAVYTQADLLQSMGAFHRAAVYFRQALEIAKRHRPLSSVLSCHLELVDVFTETGALTEAEHHLREARALERSTSWPRVGLEGRLSVKKHLLDQAVSQLEQAWALAKGEELEETYALEVVLARAQLARGDFAAAAGWAARAITRAEQLQKHKPPLLFRSLLAAKFRDAHEVRFVASIKLGQTHDAIAALDAWLQPSAFEALAPEATTTGDLQAATNETRKLAELRGALDQRRPTASNAGAAPHEPAFLGLVLAEQQLWRVTSAGGEARIVSLGPLDDQRQATLRQFRTEPTDPGLAAEVGAWLMEPALAVAERAPLRLFVDGRLGALPLEAARLGQGPPLVALRPVVRVLRVRAGPCVEPAATPRAHVVADSLGDLPHARAEAERLARATGATLALGDRATTSALLAASEGDFLHVATHGEESADGGVLRLADRRLHAIDLAISGKAPQRVVLSTCASAASTHGYQSLATGYLAAGARQVVATHRPVTDAGAAAIIARVYRDGIPADLPAALAAAQRELARTDSRDWPHFAVYGEPTCSAAPPPKPP